MRSEKKRQKLPQMKFFRENFTSYTEIGVLSRFLGSDCKPEVVLWQFLRMRNENREL